MFLAARVELLQVSGVEVGSHPLLAYLQQLHPCCENIVFQYIIQSFVLKVLQNIFPKVS